MNTISASSPLRVSASPLQRSLALVVRLQSAFPQCALSLGLIWGWLLEQLGLQRHWSREAQAVDDPLESALLTFEEALPTLKAALANDTPQQRRKIMVAAHCILAAARETHRRTEKLALEINHDEAPAYRIDRPANPA